MMASSVKKKRPPPTKSNMMPGVRVLSLTLDEAEMLLDACTRSGGKRHPMVKVLLAFIVGFEDDVVRLEELTKRLRGNSFWESDEWKQPVNPYLQPIKEDQQQKKGEILKQLASLGAEEVRPMVNGQPKRGKPKKLAR